MATFLRHRYCMAALVACLTPAPLLADGPVDLSAPASAPSASAPATQGDAQEQRFNFHLQNTNVVQTDLPFSADYSGPNSLYRKGETQETISIDAYVGARLWDDAEAHMDGLMWQGFGLSQTLGVEDFPNGDAYKTGTSIPNFTVARLFIRQTFGFGGEQEDVADGPFTLAGKQDVSRLTITVGRFTPTDIIDTNAYAGDPHTQFLNWAFVNNIAFDYAADSIGYTTGAAIELNQANWALRYTFFQMPKFPNSDTWDDQALTWTGRGSDGQFLRSWDMAVELERRYAIGEHPGVVRLLSWVNEADMATYAAATAILQAQGPSADISPARSYRFKYGFGLNWEQEVAKNVGVFSRLGWNDGHEEGWAFSDVNYSASLGVSIKGEPWGRPDDTAGFAGVISGASTDQQHFLEAGGLGILDGDGKLTYAWEKAFEAYYDFKTIWRLHFAFDYQLIIDPAFNHDRGPVDVFGVRSHFDF